jgi:hypothetical protein
LSKKKWQNGFADKFNGWLSPPGQVPGVNGWLFMGVRFVAVGVEARLI